MSVKTSLAHKTLMTGEEFFDQYGNDCYELHRGTLRETPMSTPDHGFICATLVGLIWSYLQGNDMGRVASNDTKIRLNRNPDTVYGPDVCYFSYERMPREERVKKLCDIIPDLTCEIRSQSNTWNEIFTKVEDYRAAGVNVVIVLDGESQTVSVYHNDADQQTLRVGDILELPELFPGFAVPVERFFA